MKKFTKVLAAALAAVLVAGPIAACDTNGEDEVTTTITTAGDHAETDPAETDPVETDPIETEPQGEAPTLIYHTIGGTPADLDLVNDAMNDYSSEQINIEADIVFHGWNDYGSNLNTYINSGEYWDIAFGSAINGYVTFAQRGNFADMTPLLEEATELRDFVPEELWTGMTLSDGRIFGVPAYKDSAATQYWVYDNDYIEDYDIDIENIIELEDLTPVLERIKEDQPDSYPMLLDRNGINSLNFEYEHQGGGVGVLFGTTEAVNIYAQEDVQAKYHTLREWYEAGYINPDANTLETIPAGTNPISSAQGFVGADALWSANRTDGPVTSHPRLGPMYTSSSIQGSFVVINEGSNHKQAAADYIELLNIDPEMRNLYAYGIEGTHWEFVDGSDQVITRLDKMSDYDVPAYSQATFMTMYVTEGADPEQWLKVAEQNETAETSELLGFVFNNSSVTSEIAALDNVITKYETSLNTGAQDPGPLLEEMIREQEQIGIQRVIDEVQRQIDEFLAG